MNGYSQGAILRALKLTSSQRKHVYQTIRRRTGLSCSVTTPRLKKMVQQRIWRNPRRYMRKLAVNMKVSRCSIAEVVKRGLGMKSFKQKKVHSISQIVKVKRLARCKGVLRRHAVEIWTKFYSQIENYSPIRSYECTK